MESAMSAIRAGLMGFVLSTLFSSIGFSETLSSDLTEVQARYKDKIILAQYAREDVRRGYRSDTYEGVQKAPQGGLTFDQIQTLQQSLRDQQLSSVPRDARDRRGLMGQ